MTGAKNTTQGRRSAARPVVVTGACGRLGKLLAQRLHRQGPLIGIDRRPFPDRPSGVEHLQQPLHRKAARDLFRTRKIRAVIHLGLMHDPRQNAETHHAWNVEGFAALLDYCETYGVKKLVLLSSASLYGSRPSNPQFLSEEAPLMASSRFALIADQVEVDMLAQSFFWRYPTCETVILRPCSIVGTVRNAPTRYLRLERPPVIMGYDPMIQLVHEDDVVEALVAALRPKVRGIFNLAGPTAAPLSAILRRLGRRPLRLPSLVSRPLLAYAFRWKLTDFPAAELDYVQYQCMVDDSRARSRLDWTPRRSMADVLAAISE
jgi:UDP-glucose 4-epimerase